MTPDLLLLFADRAGVFVFAISGGIVAVRKQMDLFGVIVLAFLPAIGGGTLRDVILSQPVFWLEDTQVLGLAVAGGLTAFFFHKWLENFRPLRWADAFGMALFAVTGAAKAAALGFGWPVVLIMGTMTASAGGLLRDVVANVEPLLLMKSEIYATAALLGSGVYLLVRVATGDEALAFAAGLVAAFVLRSLGIIFKLSLPRSPF
ncbi:MAG: trimeric intracellular cation channel family protein [Hyphomonas sp.]|nr:trimeric intracellular cation channel family protein [Hyphomonas sp.]